MVPYRSRDRKISMQNFFKVRKKSLRNFKFFQVLALRAPILIGASVSGGTTPLEPPEYCLQIARTEQNECTR